MRNSLFLHAGWLVIAIVAFVAGSVNSSRDQSAEATKTQTSKAFQGKKSASSVSSLNPSRSNQGGKEEAIAAGSPRGIAAGLPAASGKPLSDWDIDQLGQMMTKDSNPIRRRMAFSRLLQGLTPDNAKQIREQVMSLHHESSEFRDFHYAWGAISGAEAVLHAQKTRERDMDATMSGWASAQPDDAFNWVNDQDAGLRDRFKGSMIAGIADINPAAAADYAYQLESMGHKDADRMLGIVASRVLRSEGHLEASLWAENLPDGPMRAAALDRVAHDYVAHDPEEAASWAERFAGQPHNARVIEEVGDEWAERDPVAAINWLNSLQAGAGKSEGLSSAFGEWAKRDPTAASQHLVSMPESPERDSAISGFSRRIASENPQAAIAWAAEINDANARENALVRAGQSMFRRDASGTREWLATSGLPPAAQEQIVNPPQNRR
ncbi:MAG: hypothetical protein VYB61_11770 [Verrucomicrobiota bacterium]|nr:hypothetical protein [Verrucomicrobiota bacterium]